MINNEEFKDYQRQLNRIREAKLKEEPLPKAKQLLEPEVTFNVDISDLTLPDIEINPSPVPKPEEKPIKSNSIVLF